MKSGLNYAKNRFLVIFVIISIVWVVSHESYLRNRTYIPTLLAVEIGFSTNHIRVSYFLLNVSLR